MNLLKSPKKKSWGSDSDDDYDSHDLLMSNNKSDKKQVNFKNDKHEEDKQVFNIDDNDVEEIEEIEEKIQDVKNMLVEEIKKDLEKDFDDKSDIKSNKSECSCDDKSECSCDVDSMDEEMKSVELYGSDYLSSDESDGHSTSSFDSDNSLESDHDSKPKQLKVTSKSNTNKSGGINKHTKIKHKRIPEATRRIMNIMNTI